MISKRDLQLGKIALRAGMVTKEQLAKSLAIQKKLEKPVGLGAIFIKKGYISKEQLEEIVKLHNESKDKNGTASTGGDDEKPKKKKKKKKDKAKKDDKADKSDKSDKSEEKKAEASDSEAPKSESAPEPAAASSEEKKSSVSSGASQSEISPELLESAPSDAGPVDESDPDRRNITCEKCSKKYRIKKKQAGKKFACRKCKAKVKIPKDIFDKPVEKPAAKKASSAKNASVGVEEFSLGGSSDETSGEGDKKVDDKKADKKTEEKKQSGTQPAAAAKKQSGATALKKSGPATATAPEKKESAYGDLVKAATEKKVAPLGPKVTKGQRIFGYIQAVVFIGVVFGIVGGIWYWKHSEAAAHDEMVRQAREAEWENASAPYNKAVEATKKAVADAQAALAKEGGPPLEVLRDLTSSATDLDKAMLSMRPTEGGAVLQTPANIEKAKALVAQTKPDELLRSAYIMRGRVHLALGGESNVLEASRDFNEIVQKDPRCDEALALLGQAELRRRNYAAAIDALRRAVAIKAEPKTHAYLGVALEAGDLCKEAVKEYEALASEPLAAVFKSRALLADGDADGAIAALDGAKLEGEALGALQVRRGQALEKKGDLDGAAKAFEAAAAAGGKSGRAAVARGEFLMRIGRFEDAASSFDAALKESGGARAALGMGEAKAAVLDADAARRSYVQATSLPVVPSSAKLVDEIDAFDDPHGADPRATARRRTGDIALAAGQQGDARANYYGAAGTDPFDPEAHAAIVKLELLDKKNITIAEEHVKRAHALLASAHDHDPKTEPAPVRGAAAARVLLVEAAYWDARGDLDKADKAIDAALAADPIAAGSPAFALKGAVLQRKGEPERARSAFERALGLEESGKDAPSRFYADAVASFPAAMKGDASAIEKTRKALDVVLALNPKHAHALLMRGQVATIEKKYDDAIKHLTAAMDANSAFTDAYVARGFFYVRDFADRVGGMGEEALKDFSNAITLDPNRADAFYGRALALRAHNDVQPTLDDLNACLKLNGEYADAYKLRSEVYRQIKKDKEADADMKKYQELSKRAGGKG